MIEIEKRYFLTNEQEQSLLADADFIKETNVHDVYYDYPDYRLMKKDIRLRKRNDKFELKIRKSPGVNGEIENEKEIAQYFDLTNSVAEFVERNMVSVIEYRTLRRKYKLGEFNIDIDNTDFGYKIAEIEVLTEDENLVKESTNKIIELTQKYGFDNQKTLPKRVEYLKKYKPEVYNEIYGEK